VLAELQQLQPKAGDVVQVLVGEAFNRLDPTAQEVMQALAVYGAPVPAVAVDYLLQPYRVGIDSAPVLGRLVGMQFVRGEAGRYYLHQVDRDYALSRIPEGEPEDRAAEPPPFTRYALRHRAAEYFKETRKPREAWKTLDDLAPQLAEFDLRCAGRDWNTAAAVLAEFDYDYLLLWGHYRLVIDRHERLRGKLTDPTLEALSCGGLGGAYGHIGNYDQALRCHEDALALARAQNNRPGEAVYLGSLGVAYSDLGDEQKAIEYYEQALAIEREIGNKRNEAIDRGNLATSFQSLGRMNEGIAQYEQAIALCKEINDRPGECLHKHNLAEHYLLLGETANARALFEGERCRSRDRLSSGGDGSGAPPSRPKEARGPLGRGARAL
jgi:tetratricopeptide (TPR) repeat protein